MSAMGEAARSEGELGKLGKKLKRFNKDVDLEPPLIFQTAYGQLRWHSISGSFAETPLIPSLFLDFHPHPIPLP